MPILSKFRLLSNVRSTLNVVPSRSSGHEHKMVIEPSHWHWKRFKDMLHFYILLGAIPCGLISLYTNIFIGQAELAEIPEGYVPHEYEYYKHPISRFMKKYLVSDKIRGHELYMARLNEDAEQVVRKSVQDKIWKMMAAKADHKSWYYRPMWVDSNRYHFHAHNEMVIMNRGFHDTGNDGEAPRAPE